MKHEIVDDVLIISGGAQGFEILSTGVEGGRRRVKYILNIQVPPDFPHDNPECYVKAVAQSLRLEGGHAALLTAVQMERLQMFHDGCVTVFVTAGVRGTLSLGTINIIIVSSKALSEGAMAGSIITATESKTRALFDLGCHFTGTPTDAVIIAYERGCDTSPIAYAGITTRFGRRIGTLIRRGIMNSLKPCT